MWLEAIVGAWELAVEATHDKYGWKVSLPILLTPILLIAFIVWLLVR